jgi:geranylgeranyl diphosphate synthase type II
LREAATHIGYAFDIQDDMIDTYASQEQYGRPPCGDFIQGKKPLHVIYALYSEDKTKSEALKRLLGKKLNEKEVETARTIIRETRALEKAKTYTKIHTEKAKTLISNTKLSNEAKQYYNQLLIYIKESLEWYK